MNLDVELKVFNGGESSRVRGQISQGRTGRGEKPDTREPLLPGA